MSLQRPRADRCSHLKIAGYAGTAERPAPGKRGCGDRHLFPTVSTETEYGVRSKVRVRLPIFTGTLGSGATARMNWEHFAAGAAISGLTVVCGANVCGLDPGLERDPSGKVKKSPDMACRVAQYRRYHEGYGEMIVQMNIEDLRLGVAEYVIDRLGIECIELQWGRDCACLDGETRVRSLKEALELHRRGYLVTPNPSNPTSRAAFRAGALTHFERQTRRGFVDQEGFMKEVERMRKLGAKRVALRTGAYPVRGLDLTLQWASDAVLDLLTIDGIPGTSPWLTIGAEGASAYYLPATTQDLCRKLADRGGFVPDIALAGGFHSADHLFKILAMGAPYTKVVCMGQILTVPGMAGKSIGGWLREGPDMRLGTIHPFGATAEEILARCEELAAKYGRETAERLPLGAVGLYAYSDRVKTELQRLLAGSRNGGVSTIRRDDVGASTPDAAHVLGLAGVMDICARTARAVTS